MSENRQVLRPVDVANWLKQNPTIDGRPTGLRDAYAATGWSKTEARLKVSAGNLSSNRSALQLKRLGDNGATRRNFNLQIRPAINAEERRLNREQNRRRTELNRQYGKRAFAIDHLFPLDALGEAVMGQGPRIRSRTIKELEQVFGPVGDRTGNRQMVSNETNEQRRQASAKNPTPRKPKLKASDKITAPALSKFASVIQTAADFPEMAKDLFINQPQSGSEVDDIANTYFAKTVDPFQASAEARARGSKNGITPELGISEFFFPQTQQYREQLRRRGA